MLEQKTEKTIGDVDAVQCSSKANQLLEYSIGKITNSQT
jgi:hypothetical protein